MTLFSVFTARAMPWATASSKLLVEVAVISSYLPKQMSDDEVKAAIDKAVTDTGAIAVKDMGKVIASLRAAYAGQMDFGKVSPMVKAALGG